MPELCNEVACQAGMCENGLPCSGMGTLTSPGHEAAGTPIHSPFCGPSDHSHFLSQGTAPMCSLAAHSC